MSKTIALTKGVSRGHAEHNGIFRKGVPTIVPAKLAAKLLKTGAFTEVSVEAPAPPKAPEIETPKAPEVTTPEAPKQPKTPEAPKKADGAVAPPKA